MGRMKWDEWETGRMGNENEKWEMGRMVGNGKWKE